MISKLSLQQKRKSFLCDSIMPEIENPFCWDECEIYPPKTIFPQKNPSKVRRRSPLYLCNRYADGQWICNQGTVQYCNGVSIAGEWCPCFQWHWAVCVSPSSVNVAVMTALTEIFKPLKVISSCKVSWYTLYNFISFQIESDTESQIQSMYSLDRWKWSCGAHL